VRREGEREKGRSGEGGRMGGRKQEGAEGGRVREGVKLILFSAFIYVIGDCS
jgi:hypothetical protein